MTAADQEPMGQPAGLPMGLRERVMAASLLARGAGQPVPAVPEISGAEAFGRAADAFYRLLCALGEEDWTKPALRGLDVQGLVGHLIGVEEDVQRSVAGDPDVAFANHVDSTQPAAVRQADRSPAQTRAEWRQAADRTLDLAGESDAKVAVHGIRLPVDALLVVRAFELWVHDNDVRRAVGLPPSVPDTPVLRLMSDLAARMLPYAAARMGLPPADVHLVLTGPGGGTWDVATGQGAGGHGTGGQEAASQESLAIVADAVGFCRLAANRITPAELDPHITGDADRATDVLAA